nr:hypothetical protein [Kingella denitrificans]
MEIWGKQPARYSGLKSALQKQPALIQYLRSFQPFDMRGFLVFRCLPFGLLQDGIYAGKCRIIDNVFSKTLYIFNEIMLQTHIGRQFGFQLAVAVRKHDNGMETVFRLP